MNARVLVPGTAKGDLLRFGAPISFWGGVDPVSGRVSDPRHPQYDQSLSGRVIALADTVGSSSSSAIMLELMRNGTAPSGVLVRATDAILVLGVVVGIEMGYEPVPVLELGEDFARLPDTGAVEIADGTVSVG